MHKEIGPTPEPEEAPEPTPEQHAWRVWLHFYMLISGSDAAASATIFLICA